MELDGEVWVVPAHEGAVAVDAARRGIPVVVVGDAHAVGEVLRSVPPDAERLAGWTSGAEPGLRELLAELYPGAAVVFPAGGSLDALA
jgi:hypothetical protein